MSREIPEDLLPPANLILQALGTRALPYLGRYSAKEVQAMDRNHGTGEVMDATTAHDQPTELFLIEGLRQLEPAALIVGEETAHPGIFAEARQGKVWVVDPIDGTNNYARGLSGWGSLLSYAEDGETTKGWLAEIYETGDELHLRLFAADQHGPIWQSRRLTLPFVKTAEDGIARWVLQPGVDKVPLPELGAKDFTAVPPPAPPTGKPVGWINTRYFATGVLQAGFAAGVDAQATAIDWQRSDFFAAAWLGAQFVQGKANVVAWPPTRPWDISVIIFFARKLGGDAVQMSTGLPAKFYLSDGGVIIATSAAYLESTAHDLFGHSLPLGCEPCTDEFLTVRSLKNSAPLAPSPAKSRGPSP